MCDYQGVNNIRFSESLACFVFLLTPFWDLFLCFTTNEIVLLTDFWPMFPFYNPMWELKKPCNCPEEAHDIFGQVAENIKKSLVIREKGKSQNGGYKKTKHAKFLKKNISYPRYAHVRLSGGKQYSFFGKFSVLCFLVNSVLRFVLVLYYQRNRIINRFLANVPVL